jgi:acyl-coenzyme A thioesterase PaaI-like protein
MDMAIRSCRMRDACVGVDSYINFSRALTKGPAVTVRAMYLDRNMQVGRYKSTPSSCLSLPRKSR